MKVVFDQLSADPDFGGTYITVQEIGMTTEAQNIMFAIQENYLGKEGYR